MNIKLENLSAQGLRGALKNNLIDILSYKQLKPQIWESAL